jgi:hypothetical protein
MKGGFMPATKRAFFRGDAPSHFLAENPAEKRFVIHPGSVRSRHDGDVHFVGFLELARLYGVNPADCLDASTVPHWAWPKGAVHLFPGYSGDYSLNA